MVDSKVDCEPAFTSNKLACDKPISKSKICPAIFGMFHSISTILKVIIQLQFAFLHKRNVPNCLDERHPLDQPL